MDAEALPHLVPTPADAERLRDLILSVHGITVDLPHAMRIGTFLLQAAVLLPKLRQEPATEPPIQPPKP